MGKKKQKIETRKRRKKKKEPKIERKTKKKFMLQVGLFSDVQCPSKKPWLTTHARRVRKK